LIPRGFVLEYLNLILEYGSGLGGFMMSYLWFVKKIGKNCEKIIIKKYQ
jgi:hypothetical protein